MKAIVALLVLGILVMGCTQQEQPKDSVFQIDGGGTKNQPKVSVFSNGIDIELNLSHIIAYYGIEIIKQNTTMEIASCDKSLYEGLAAAVINSSNKTTCINLTCTVDNAQNMGSRIDISAHCNKNIAERNKAYIINLILSAKIPSNNTVSFMEFRSCGPGGEGFEICEAHYEIGVQKG